MVGSRNQQETARKYCPWLPRSQWNPLRLGRGGGQPINPNLDHINGETCYKNVASLPDNVERLYIVTPKDQTAGVLKDAAAKGIRNVWIQQRSEDDEAVRLAVENNINLIQKECMFKFVEPVTGPHAFHRFISKLFGSYPK